MWREVEQNFFKLLRQMLVSTLVLGYPNPTQTYILETDASGFGEGAAPSQEQGRQERIMAYYSKIFH